MVLSDAIKIDVFVVGTSERLFKIKDGNWCIITVIEVVLEV